MNAVKVLPKGMVLPCGMVATALISGLACGCGGGGGVGVGGGGGVGVGVGVGVGDGVGLGCGVYEGAQLATIPPSSTSSSTARPILKRRVLNMTNSSFPAVLKNFTTPRVSIGLPDMCPDFSKIRLFLADTRVTK